LYKKDWLMDQIEGIINLISKVFLHKENANYIVSDISLSDEDLLYITLNNMIEKREINKAENLLFDEITTLSEKNLAIAINFYSKLNELNDETLKDANYSREEITQGLHDIMQRFGIQLELS